MTRALGAVAVGAVIAGCSTLPELGRCGNGVVEAGEACDEDGQLCTPECQLACIDEDEGRPPGYVEAGIDPDGVTEYCPAGHTCGVDEVCRAPSGRFAVAGDPVPIAGDQVEAGDVDGDQIADLVIVGTSAIEVRFGAADPAETFSASALLATPIITGRAVAIDYFNAGDPDRDLDGVIDMLAPTVGGLLKYVGKDGRLQSEVTLDALHPMGSTALQAVLRPLVPATVQIGADRVAVGVFAGDTTGGQRIVAITDIEGTNAGVCVLPATQAWELMDELGAATNSRGEVAVAVEAPGGLQRVCVFSLTGNTFVGRAVAPGIPITRTGRLTYVPTGGPCQDLLAPTGGLLAPQLHSIHASGAGCDTLAWDPVQLPFSSGLAGRLAGAVDLGTQVMLVIDNSVYRLDGSAWTPYRTFTLPGAQAWSSIVVGDVDGSGRPAFVANRFEVGSARPDLDIVRFTGSGSGGPLLQHQIVDTFGGVKGLVGGDFNGDGLLDVAVVEAADAGTDALGIAYGRRGTVASGITFLDDFEGALVVATDSDPEGSFHDGLDDLVLILASSDTTRYPLGWATGELFGAPGESMAGPQWEAQQKQRPTLTAVVPVPAAAPAQFDVTLYSPSQAPDGTASLTKWSWQAAGIGEFAANDNPIETDLFVGGELATAGVTTADGARAIVAVDGSGSIYSDLPAVPCDAAATVIPGGVPTIRAADLDDAPGDELLIAVRARFASQDSEVYLAGAVPAPCAQPASLMPLSAVAATTGCADAVAFEAGGDDAMRPELALACPAELVVLENDAGAWRRAEPPTGIGIDDRPIAITPGDFNGDGVTDFVLATKAGALTRVQLILQCPTTDLDCAP